MAEEVLLEEISPNGNLVARVEQDSRCAYFYLEGEPEGPFGLRSCWVRNLGAAPAQVDREAMKSGDAPMLPAGACAHPQGAPPLVADGLRVVWFEEGDAAALQDGDAVLAVIPCWSGVAGFEGYARDCTAKTPFCWPLPPDSPLLPRLARAAEFWSGWRSGEPWPAIEASGLAAIGAGLGEPSARWSVDGGEWPPQAVFRVPRDGHAVLITLGVSIRPQPRAELAKQAPPRRIELAVAVEDAYLDRAPKTFLAWLRKLGSLPWDAIACVEPGSVVPTEALPVTPTGVRFEAAVLAADPPGAPRVAFPAYRGDEVRLLWAVPITAKERVLAQEIGGAEFLGRLAAAGHPYVLRYRDSIA